MPNPNPNREGHLGVFRRTNTRITRGGRREIKEVYTTNLWRRRARGQHRVGPEQVRQGASTGASLPDVTNALGRRTAHGRRTAASWGVSRRDCSVVQTVGRQTSRSGTCRFEHSTSMVGFPRGKGRILFSLHTEYDT